MGASLGWKVNGSGHCTWQFLLWSAFMSFCHTEDKGRDEQSHSHYFRTGFLSRVTLDFQGNSFKNKSVTDCCKEASLITAEVWACDVLHHFHPGAEVLWNESMPEKCPEHCRVSGMEWRAGVTCTSHCTGTWTCFLSSGNLIVFKVNAQLCVDFHLTCKECLSIWFQL